MFLKISKGSSIHLFADHEVKPLSLQRLHLSHTTVCGSVPMCSAPLEKHATARANTARPRSQRALMGRVLAVTAYARKFQSTTSSKSQDSCTAPSEENGKRQQTWRKPKAKLTTRKPTTRERVVDDMCPQQFHHISTHLSLNFSTSYAHMNQTKQTSKLLHIAFDVAHPCIHAVLTLDTVLQERSGGTLGVQGSQLADSCELNGSKIYLYLYPVYIYM